MQDLPDDFAAVVREAAGRTDIVAAMEGFYAELDGEIAAQRSVCVNRGACCRFDEYGHRLYVTTLEAAFFVAHCPGGRVELTAADERGCPYQINGSCTARTARPMGCRVYFCDPHSREWQGPLTERMLDRLRALHRATGVPYHYAEWRSVLRRLAGDGTTP
jgi:Fe-S-cluster containining protein